jgi:hypothetical protein
MITAFTEVITTLRARGYHPALNVMDNGSAAVEKHIKASKINIQLIPPHNHCVNAAKQATATFKEHFIAALATVDKLCPLQLWDELLPQVELTLNMLCFSCHNPNQSANLEIYGPFDFNKNTIGPARNQSPHLQGSRLSCILGTARNRWILHWTSGGPLPMSALLYPRNRTLVVC